MIDLFDILSRLTSNNSVWVRLDKEIMGEEAREFFWALDSFWADLVSSKYDGEYSILNPMLVARSELLASCTLLEPTARRDRESEKVYQMEDRIITARKISQKPPTLLERSTVQHYLQRSLKLCLDHRSNIFITNKGCAPFATFHVHPN